MSHRPTKVATDEGSGCPQRHFCSPPPLPTATPPPLLPSSPAHHPHTLHSSPLHVFTSSHYFQPTNQWLHFPTHTLSHIHTHTHTHTPPLLTILTHCTLHFIASPPNQHLTRIYMCSFVYVMYKLCIKDKVWIILQKCLDPSSRQEILDVFIHNETK